nr:uncharacterized protein LOC123748058 [Procambarus clarkii]
MLSDVHETGAHVASHVTGLRGPNQVSSSHMNILDQRHAGHPDHGLLGCDRRRPTIPGVLFLLPRHRLPPAGHHPYHRILRDGVLGSVTFRRFKRAQRSPRECGGQRPFRKLPHSIFPPVLSQQSIELPHLESFTKLTLRDLGFNNLQAFPNVSSDSLETLHVNMNPLGCFLWQPSPPHLSSPASTCRRQLRDIPSVFPSGVFSGLAYLKEAYLFRNCLREVLELTVEINPAMGGVSIPQHVITTFAVNALPGVSERGELLVNSLTEVQQVGWRPRREAGVTLLQYGNPKL